MTSNGIMGMDQNRNRNRVPPAGRRGSTGEVDASVTTAMLETSAGSSTVSSRKRGRLRHESTETEVSEISTTLERAPPDGGWGWVVVGAAFFVNLIADGVTFSFGVFYVEFLNFFGTSKATTAWVGSLLAAMPLLSGPIASSLTDRFGCRRVTIAGGLLSSIGFILSSHANSIWVLYITFGIITGFGLSLCYVAAVVIVAYYFEDRRSLATGLSVCGGGIGTFLFAPLTQYLIDEYGWRGTTLIFAGAFLNLCVCGALMRDLEWTKKKAYKAQHHNHNHHHVLPCVDLVSNDISSMKNERLCNSAICIPTFVQEQEQHRSAEHFHAYSNHQNFGIISAVAAATEISNNHSSSFKLKDTGCKDSGDKKDKEVNDMTSLTNTSNTITPNTVTIINPNSNSASNNNSSSNNSNIAPTPGQLQRTAQQAAMRNYVVTNTSSWSGLHRHSLTYRGAVLSLKRYRLRPASSCPDIISVATADDRSSHEWMAVVGDVCKWLRGVCEWQHLKNTKFLLFIMSNLLLYMWYDVPYVYLQDAALQSGYSEELSSYLISIVGLFNMIGNVVLGYMGDKKWANSIVVYGVCMVFCGAATILMPSCQAWNFSMLATACAIFGLTIAANYSLTSVILVKVVSIECFANAYGLLLLVQGIGNLVGPPIAGVIYDLTETSSWSFVVAGGGIFASSFFILAPKIFHE